MSVPSSEIVKTITDEVENWISRTRDALMDQLNALELKVRCGGEQNFDYLFSRTRRDMCRSLEHRVTGAVSNFSPEMGNSINALKLLNKWMDDKFTNVDIKTKILAAFWLYGANSTESLIDLKLKELGKFSEENVYEKHASF